MISKTADTSSSAASRLIVLGSADAFNSGGRANSSFWVEDAQGAYLLDCGPTTPMAIKRWRDTHNLDLSALDVIYLTHLHGDHIGGLPVLLLELMFNQRRTKPLIISGPPTTEERIRTLCATCYPRMLDVMITYPIIWAEHPLVCELEVGGRAIKSIAAQHDPNAHPTSLSIDDRAGYRLVFSGDTGWNEELIDLSADASALVIECSYRDAVFPGHLSLVELERERFRLHPSRLILTHLNEEARAEATRRQGELALEVADDGSLWSHYDEGGARETTPT